MKRLFTMLLATAMILSMTACGAKKTEEPAAPPKDAPATEEPAKLDFPTKDIKLIVPFGAGGGNDIMARVIASVADKDYFNGHSLIVENMEGGGGVIGQSYVANTADADGYTLMMYTGGVVNNSFLKDNIGYTYEDFKVVIGCSGDATVLAVPADSPYNNLEEFFTAAKETPLLCSTSGFGSGPHNYPMYMEEKLGVQFDYIHGDSSAIELTNLMGGHCDFALMTVSEIMSAYEEDSVKILGAMSEERDPLMPEIPTFKEQGYEGWIDGGNRAVAVSADTPDDVYNYLVGEFAKLCASQEFIDAMNKSGLAVTMQDPATYQQYVDFKVEMMTTMAPIIKQGA